MANKKIKMSCPPTLKFHKETNSLTIDLNRAVVKANYQYDMVMHARRRFNALAGKDLEYAPTMSDISSATGKWRMLLRWKHRAFCDPLHMDTNFLYPSMYADYKLYMYSISVIERRKSP
jgi:hypothetical protein